MPRTVLATNLREAVRSLRGARLRTLLGLVSIMIGIASVIAMISTGEIAKSQSRKQFQALGTDILTIVKSAPTGTAVPKHRRTIGLEDALALADALSTVSVTAPQTASQSVFRYGGKHAGRGTMQGVSAVFAPVNKLRIAEGRFVSDMDTERYFAVVGKDVAAAMHRIGARRIIGETLQIDDRLFTVVGALEEAMENYSLPFQVKANQSVFVPISTVRRMNPQEEIRMIVARAAPGIHHSDAVRDIQAYFATRNKGLHLRVVTAEQLIAQMQSQLGLMTLLLGAVGSISLIVGGIGVMNIMLISVSERRREIGVRRALGATRWNIQGQFLTEAMILTIAGGLIGILVGTGATYGICLFTGWDFFLSFTAAIAGFGVSTIIGLFFGFQPAYQASRLDPIAALQGE